MADNYVALKIKAADDGAKPDLTDLKARLEELSGKVAEARANVDSAQADARLADLQAKLDMVSKKVASPRIDMAGASRAVAQVAAVEAAMDGLDEAGRKHGENTGRNFGSGFLSYVKPPMSKDSLIAGGILSGLASLPALTAGLGAVAGIGLAGAFLYQTGAIKPGVTSLMGTLKQVIGQAVQPMTGPLRSALAQLGSFAKQIGPQLKQVFGAIGPLVQPLVYGLEGLVGGILPGFISLMKAAAPAVQALAGLLGSLGADLGSMFSSFAPAIGASAGVLKMLGELLNGLLPVVGRVAAALAGVLGPVLQSFAGAIKSLMPAVTAIADVLGKFMAAALTSVGGALQAVGTLISALAPSFAILGKAMGQVFTLMENTGVFGVLEDSLENIAGPLAQLINAFVRGLAPAIPPIIAVLTQLSSGAVRILTGAMVDLIQGLLPFMPLLGRLTPLILGVIGAMKGWAIAQAALNAVMDMSPWGQLALAIGAVIILVEEIRKHWQTLAAVAKTAFADIKRVVMDVFDWIRGHWPLLAGILLGPVALAAGEIIQHWRQISAGAARMWSDVVGFFRRLPGDITNAVSSLAGMLYKAGVNAMRGLVNGIGSMVSWAKSTVEGWSHDVANAVTHPFGIHLSEPSEATQMVKAGRNVFSGLAKGMTSGRSLAEQAARNITVPGVHGGGYGAGYGGGYGQQRLIIELRASDSKILSGLQATVRTAGGDPQMFIRKVAFR